MGRMVKRLSQLEIDEVSLVDRPANQHGLVAIAKNHQEDDMPDLFDSQGNPVDEDELQHGDYVYDEAGNEYAYTESDPNEDGGEGDFAEEYEEEGALVGKAAPAWAQYAARRGGQKLSDEKLATQMFVGRQRGRLGRAGREAVESAGERGAAANRATRRHLRRNRGLYATGAAAGVGSYGGSKVGKSFGQEVLEELSKALNDDERDTVISKAMDVVEDIAKRNDELEQAVALLLDDREGQDFYEIAKGYEVPVETGELAGVLHRASQTLPPGDLEVLDRLLSGASEITKSYFEEVGYGGPGESDIMEQIAAMADQAVTKGADLGLTREQAIAALFESNPAAYDAYEAETRY